MVVVVVMVMVMVVVVVMVAERRVLSAELGLCAPWPLRIWVHSTMSCQVDRLKRKIKHWERHPFPRHQKPERDVGE